MKKFLFVFFVLASATIGHAQKYHPDIQAVRDVVEKWNDGYQALDAEAIVATAADEYDIVNRFGKKVSLTSREEHLRMWKWVFSNVYKGKPGPEHIIENVRLLTPDVAVVHATATRTEPVILPNGEKIPPFTQFVTFLLVKKKDWKITSHSIHNQFPDPHSSEQLPWRTAETVK